MVSLFKTKYRVVRDAYAGYEVQAKKWWFPFWLEVGTNTHLSLERAIKYVESLKNPVLWSEDK